MAGQRSTRVLPTKTKPSSALLRLQSFSKASHEPLRLLVRPCTADEFKAFAAGGCLYKLARQWLVATPNIFFSKWLLYSLPICEPISFVVPYLSRMAGDVQMWCLSRVLNHVLTPPGPPWRRECLFSVKFLFRI